MINHSHEIRTPLELWLVVEEFFNSYVEKFGFKYGLCYIIELMKQGDILSYSEKFFLTNEIVVFAESIGIMGHEYIWPSGNIEFRKKFIQDQILKAIRDDGTVQT